MKNLRLAKRHPNHRFAYPVEFRRARSFLTNLPQFLKYWHLKDIDIATTSVRLNQDLIDKAKIIARALNRALSKQTERWQNSAR
jgi:hypothetical protein